MIANNKLDKSFGPVGTIAGVIIFVAGILSLYYSWFGFILVLFGAFVGFTSTSTLIDFDSKRVKFSNNLFGFIVIGRWVNIESGMKIGIRKSNKAWRTYSRGNRILDIAKQDYRIILSDSINKQVMQLKKVDTIDSAKFEVEKLANQLGLSIA